MRVFAIGIERAFDAPLQQADACIHERPAMLGHHDQRFGRGLPFGEVLPA
jgi:hypothetical protein